MKKTISHMTQFLIIATLLFAAGCTTYDDTGGGGGGGGSSQSCDTGYCLNNGQCCPSATPNYADGTHSGADYYPYAACYASCPYVGDCGSTTECF